MNRIASNLVLAGLVAALLAGTAVAGDWTFWRGPTSDGVADAENLVSNWSVDGENQIWRADFIGRSTPVVFGNRVCANGRARREGDDRATQEMRRLLRCRPTGSSGFGSDGSPDLPHLGAVDPCRLGQHHGGCGDRLSVYVPGGGRASSTASTVPDGEHRLVAQPDRRTSASWLSGYGGRTQTPVVDEDRVIVTFANTSWGDEGSAAPPHVRAFDKRTGEQLWSRFARAGSRWPTRTVRSTPCDRRHRRAEAGDLRATAAAGSTP